MYDNRMKGWLYLMMSNMEKNVFKILETTPGIRAVEISQILGLEGKEVNRILYGTLINECAYRDEDYCWYSNPLQLEGNVRILHSIEMAEALNNIRRDINTLHKIIEFIAEDKSDVFYPAKTDSAYYADRESLDYFVDHWIFEYCMDLTTDYGELEEWEFDFVLNLMENNLPYKAFSYEDYLKEYGEYLVGEEDVPGFIIGAVEYDKRNDTEFAMMLIRCLESIGKNVQHFCKEELDTQNFDPTDLLIDTVKYVYTQILMEEEPDIEERLLLIKEEKENNQYDEYDFDDEEKNYRDFLRISEYERRMEIKEAYKILNEMMDSFETWFPASESDTEEEMGMYKARFAETKLQLELGEYSGEDKEYLSYIQEILAKNSRYQKTIGVFIRELSEEYGWI